MHQKASMANRLQKVLEDANLKLASVATDVLGLSGRDMLQAIIAGQDNPEALAELARGKLRAKIPELRVALQGRVTEHHRFLLKLLFDQVMQLEELSARGSAHRRSAARAAGRGAAALGGSAWRGRTGRGEHP